MVHTIKVTWTKNQRSYGYFGETLIYHLIHHAKYFEVSKYKTLSEAMRAANTFYDARLADNIKNKRKNSYVEMYELSNLRDEKCIRSNTNHNAI